MKKTLENDNQITLTTGWFGCDGCIARAQVKVVFDFGVLYFCGHHANEFGYTLAMKSIGIYDPEGILEYADH